MRRIQFFEFGDLDWFPKSLRREGMELLAAMEKLMGSYSGSKAVLEKLLADTGRSQIVALAAGSGGGIPDLPNVVLTDIFPDKDYEARTGQRYEQHPVDATNVPRELHGVRVMYTAFHHFRPELAHKILKDAVDANEPIAIFEVTERSLRGILMILLMPLLILVITPFVRPFRLTRLLWTYVIPVVLFFVLFDGIVSCLRTYTQEELERLTADLTSYDWAFTYLKTATGIERPSAFVGKPKSPSAT